MAYRTEAEIRRENEQIRRRIATLESAMDRVRRARGGDEIDRMREAQRRADGVAALFGERVPEPTPDDTELSYRRRLLRKIAQHSPKYRNADFSGLDMATAALMERHVFADAADNAHRAAQRPGQLIESVERDYSGRLVRRFYGDPLVWMQHFMRGGTRGRIIRPQGAQK